MARSMVLTKPFNYSIPGIIVLLYQELDSCQLYNTSSPLNTILEISHFGNA